MAVDPKVLLDWIRKVNNITDVSSSLSREYHSQVYQISNEYSQRIRGLITQNAREIKEVGQNARMIIPSSRTVNLTNDIQREVDAMIRKLAKLSEGGVKQSAQEANATFLDLRKSLSTEGAFFQPSSELVSVASQYTADVITTLATKYLPKVNGIISRAVLGGMSPFDAMKELDALIGRGADGGVSYEAERIIRTEMGTIHSIARKAQMDKLTVGLQGLKKEWQHGSWRDGRRTGHRDADGQMVDYDKSFSVASVSGGKKELLDFPRDPKASAANRINCMCRWKINEKSLIDSLNA